MRHTYASMMLSNSENIMWIAKQMGHVNIEMVMRIYGKWLPDNSIATGYKPVNDWSKHIELAKSNGPVVAPQHLKNDNFEEDFQFNQLHRLASPRGFEISEGKFSYTLKTVKDIKKQG